MTYGEMAVEASGWMSTGAFLISIVHPKRNRVHQIGLFTAVTTCIYAFYHGATAIWVKWIIAFFFHLYVLWKIKKGGSVDADQKIVRSDDVEPAAKARIAA